VRTAGLTPVASKSAAYSSEQDMAVVAAAELGVLHARDGLVVAGAPIGTRDGQARSKKITFFMITHDESRRKFTSRFDISRVRDYHAFLTVFALFQRFGMYSVARLRDPVNIHVPCIRQGRPEREN
jgi:hypothetical protein